MLDAIINFPNRGELFLLSFLIVPPQSSMSDILKYSFVNLQIS